MLKTILHKRVFYISFIVFLMTWYALSAQEVVSFTFFKTRTFNQNVKLGEHYVKQGLVDDTVIGTVVANISFGEDTYTTDQHMHNALRLYDTSYALLAVDVLDLVTSADDAEAALNGHVKHLENTLRQITDTRDGLLELTDQHKTASENCLAEKREGDRLFFDGVEAGNSLSTAAGLDQSVEHAPCYITNRIHASAYAYLAERVAVNYAILARRHEILIEEGHLLIEHTSYFEGDILERLLNLKEELEQINQVEYDSFQQRFDFTLYNQRTSRGSNYAVVETRPNIDFSPLYDLDDVPSYQRSYFGESGIPTYENPDI